MNKKHTELWKYLYSTLTTSQINQVLRRLDLNHSDWIEFLEVMEGELSSDPLDSVEEYVPDKTRQMLLIEIDIEDRAEEKESWLYDTIALGHTIQERLEEADTVTVHSIDIREAQL